MPGQFHRWAPLLFLIVCARVRDGLLREQRSIKMWCKTHWAAGGLCSGGGGGGRCEAEAKQRCKHIWRKPAGGLRLEGCSLSSNGDAVKAVEIGWNWRSHTGSYTGWENDIKAIADFSPMQLEAWCRVPPPASSHGRRNSSYPEGYPFWAHRHGPVWLSDLLLPPLETAAADLPIRPTVRSSQKSRKALCLANGKPVMHLAQLLLMSGVWHWQSRFLGPAYCPQNL